MKLKFTSHIFGIYCLTLLVITSCTSKKNSEQPGDLTDIKDFPKEWVLADDIAPSDSIIRNYVVLVDSSNAFAGSVTIQQNGSDWQLINAGFYYPGTYRVKNCKRTTEGEMVYFNFDLQSIQETTQLKIQVNFRHHPEDPAPLTSVFTYWTPGSEKEDALLVEKTMADRFQKKSLQSLQYD